MMGSQISGEDQGFIGDILGDILRSQVAIKDPDSSCTRMYSPLEVDTRMSRITHKSQVRCEESSDMSSDTEAKVDPQVSGVFETCC